MLLEFLNDIVTCICTCSLSTSLPHPLTLSPSLAGVLDFLLSDTPVPIHYQNMAAATKSSFSFSSLYLLTLTNAS